MNKDSQRCVKTDRIGVEAISARKFLLSYKFKNTQLIRSPYVFNLVGLKPFFRADDLPILEQVCMVLFSEIRGYGL
jgi:hypothetical protein